MWSLDDSASSGSEAELHEPSSQGTQSTWAAVSEAAWPPASPPVKVVEASTPEGKKRMLHDMAVDEEEILMSRASNKRLRRVMSNPDGQPLFIMSQAGPELVQPHKYTSIPGTEWWMQPICDATAARRAVRGDQTRPLVVHSLCAGLGTEFFVSQDNRGERALRVGHPSPAVVS